MAKIEKPLYVNPTGPNGPKDLPSSPPFSFHGVNCRLFPLQANISRLTDFCDDYLNMDIPDSIVHYIPALPYVYFTVIDYGRMSPLLFSAQQTGWVSQREVFFLIPLEVWRRERGKMVFKEWACVSPFIFVDDTLSLTTGREVYGWAKILTEIEQDPSSLMQDLAAPARVFGMKAPVFPKEYAGRREENRVFVEVIREPAPNLVTFPFLQGGALPGLSDSLKTWIGLAGDGLDMLSALPIRGYRSTRSIGSTLQMTKVAAAEALRMFPTRFRRRLVEQTQDSPLGYGREAEAFVNQITLKQFRAVGHPDQACYQSLVSSRMGLDRVNRCGLLGDYRVLLGDPSGGYSVRVHQYNAYPVVDSLGLKVHRTEQVGEAQVAVLKPVFPFWTDVDLYYDKGKTVCYRHRGESSNAKPSPWLTEDDDGHSVAGGVITEPPEYGIPYNTIRGGSTQAVVGPFHFPDVTLQVYPLLASRDKLKEFVDTYLNSPLNPAFAPASGIHFETFGEYAYLMVESIGRTEGVMWSETNNLGQWADKTVAFCVPVKLIKDGKLHSIALASPYRFANDNRAVISDREINGRIAVMSTIQGPPDVWLDESGPVKERNLLELSTEVLPALDVGAQTETRVLLRVSGKLPEDYNNTARWRLVGDRWRNPLLADLVRKTAYTRDNPELVEKAKTLALQLFALQAPINWINIKQYRDAEFNDRACYQSLVNVSRVIERVFDIREIEERLFVRITDLPDFPIVSALGLKTLAVTSGEDVEHVLQPIRPFWMRISVKENLGETLAWRVDAGAWNLTAALTTPLAGGHLRVGKGLLDALDVQKQRLHKKATHWLFEQLAREVKEIRNKLPTLPEEIREKLVLTLEQQSAAHAGSTAIAVALEAAKSASKADAADRLRKLFRSLSTNDLYEVVEALTGPLAGLGEKIQTDRYPAADARSWLQALDEVQTVIEPILSDEWEHWGDSRSHERAQHRKNPESAKNPRQRKPDFCVMADTFQSDGLDLPVPGRLVPFEDHWRSYEPLDGKPETKPGG